MLRDFLFLYHNSNFIIHNSVTPMNYSVNIGL